MRDPALGPTSDDAARAIANELERRGLGPMARLLADAHRPVAPLLADLGASLGGLIAAAGGPRSGGVRNLLQDPAALDRLLAHLETDAERADAERR